MDLGSLKAKRAPLKFELDGETVNAEFYPHKLTPEYRASLQRLAKQDEDSEEGGFDTDAKMCAEMLASWDVQADGEPYPPTYENLLAAPQSLVTRIALEMLNEVGKLSTPKPLRK